MTDLDARVIDLLRNAGAHLDQRIAVHTERCETFDAVKRALPGPTPDADGWICTPSSTPTRWRGEPPAEPILAAELALDAHRSVHVRHTGSAWLVTTIAEHPHDASEGTRCLGDELSLRSTLEDGHRPRGLDRPRLVYRRFWRLASRGPEDASLDVLQPWIARFAGWSEDTKEIA